MLHNVLSNAVKNLRNIKVKNLLNITAKTLQYLATWWKTLQYLKHSGRPCSLATTVEHLTQQRYAV